MISLCLTVFLTAAAPLPPAPVEDRPLPNPVLEARAVALQQSLRCVVCQNESIAESGAVLAADLRQVVRERVAAGDSDEEVRAFMVTRYGDFVLLKPPFEPATWLLWLGPMLVLLLGGLAVVAYLRRRRAVPEADALSADERARLEALLAEEDEA
ncbi:MAG: cytochrome c-type biogenesis protein CcmH [Caulobacterales bacterium]|nr:cytochrome c-type biogenesis protein CcmH [Caulobacterales bacterium]